MIIDDLFEASQSCPHCGGPMFSEMLMMEKKDACYYKVKASAKVWPSAYASGRLVQCRKKGAGNYGNKSEGVMEMDKSQTPPGRDGSNDLDAGKKEYTATPTTPGAVARQGGDILNKAFKDSQRVDPRTGKKMNTKGVAEGSLEELANTSLKVKEPKGLVNTNDRKQVTYKIMKFKSGKDTYLINFTVKGAPAFGKKSNWNAVNVAFGVREEQDDYSFGDEMNTDLTARNKNQFLIYSTVINAIRKFITEYNTEIDEIIMQGAGERQVMMYQRFFRVAPKYFPGWHYDGKHSLVRDVPRQTGKKVREQGVAEEYELAGVGVAYELGRRAYKQGMTIRDNPYSATREARKNDEWAKGLERGKHDANDARHFRNSVREQGVAEKLGDDRPKLGSKRDSGKSIRKWRSARGLDETGVAEGDLDEGWKEKLGGAALAGAMALGAGGANARVMPGDDPGINRLTGKPIATQQATDTAPTQSTSSFSIVKPQAQYDVDTQTLTYKGKQYKWNSDARATGQGEVVTAPSMAVGSRSMGSTKVELNPNGTYTRAPANESQEKVGDMDADKFDAAMARLKQLAGAGPLKTVYDPQKRVYRNVPTAQQPKK